MILRVVLVYLVLCAPWSVLKLVKVWIMSVQASLRVVERVSALSWNRRMVWFRRDLKGCLVPTRYKPGVHVRGKMDF